MKKVTLLGKSFIVGLLLTGLTLSGCGASQSASNDQKPATDQKVIKMRLSQSKSDSHPVSQGYNKFAELVKEKTNGKLVIDVFNNGVLGDDRVSIESAQSGTIEFAGSSTPNMLSLIHISEPTRLGMISYAV